MRRTFYGVALAAVLATAGSGTVLAQAGLLTGGATKLEPPLKLSAWQPLAEAPYALEAGKYYELEIEACLLYTSPSPRDISGSRMPSSA